MSKLDELAGQCYITTSDRLHSVLKRSLFRKIFIQKDSRAVAMQEGGKRVRKANAE